MGGKEAFFCKLSIKALSSQTTNGSGETNTNDTV